MEHPFRELLLHKRGKRRPPPLDSFQRGAAAAAGRRLQRYDDDDDHLLHAPADGELGDGGLGIAAHGRSITLVYAVASDGVTAFGQDHTGRGSLTLDLTSIG